MGNAEPRGAIYEKVKEGYDSGLFEVGIHGYSGGTTYDTLDYETQLQRFKFANGKLTRLLGSPSQLFVPPLGKLNADTIRAMADSNPPIKASFQPETKARTRHRTRVQAELMYDTGRGIVEISDVNGIRIYTIFATTFLTRGSWL
ncbi:putative polysaccharide deacetylase [Candidatus Nitrososphaera gargensis Ga9.2]|uniref:Putative polysaccharide deacetylase n=1 Tax=Nitrososphaera gargensis (strain Ga9.2) TaxID=1237085 RepID=K0IGA6_NITGG|nr:polysaccharide deacetylase family protein [Candidatus Nitrososphaera gargensis]AFU57858.1 putative polysaccharide deacetylase [Candidatus Nitrososphaera gargensis Ga9.2]